MFKVNDRMYSVLFYFTISIYLYQIAALKQSETTVENVIKINFLKKYHSFSEQSQCFTTYNRIL